MTDSAETAWLDLHLAYDRATRRVDLTLGEDGDLALDATPAPAMLLSVGCDRRARPDDVLPTGITELNAPSSFIERRGWAGDAVDGQGDRTGCRLWLLDRAKETELTRLMAVEWLKEGFAWVERDVGRPAEVSAQWISRDVLGIRVVIGRFNFSLNRPV